MVRGGPFFGEKMGIKKGFTIINWNGRGGRLEELTDGCYSEGDSQELPGFIHPHVLGIPTIGFQ